MSAQEKRSTNIIKVHLVDSLTRNPLGFVTVYVSKDGSSDGAIYNLTDDAGRANLERVPNGKLIFKAEMMGYHTVTKNVTVSERITNLGTIAMLEDVQVLEQAVITAAGNPIVVKKDTIEYTASSFKTTDNDMLIELLKKLPGIEVGTDGSITANGKSISKITIDGKTFFMDDPQLATQNIPAKIVDKVKVLEKKSEQAEFTGIDDGEEETVIDLSIQKGMMKGWFGNVSAGGGLDTDKGVNGKLSARWQGSAMIGRFTDNDQISIILNGNNTNNRGFQDMAGGMLRSGGGMGGSMGGGMFGGNNGINTTWMGGVNFNTYLEGSKDKEIGGNYMYNGSSNTGLSETSTTRFLNNETTQYSRSTSESYSLTQGHRVGLELDYAVNKQASIFFRPNFNYGYGRYNSSDVSATAGSQDFSEESMINSSESKTQGLNNNWRANGRFLYRQKITSTKGRTLSLNLNYNLNNNNTYDAFNTSRTYMYIGGEVVPTIIDQKYSQKSEGYSINSTLTYTEPLGLNWYLQFAYSFNWSLNKSEKNTYNVLERDEQGNVVKIDTEKDPLYSNWTRSSTINQNIRVDVNKQEDKWNLQFGFSAQPYRQQVAQSYLDKSGETKDRDTVRNAWNFAPSLRFDYDFSDFSGLRLRYNGRTTQPTINQLAPVPDNSNPLYISLGNSNLRPYFRHNLNFNYRYTNMKSYASVNVMADGSYTMDNIINATWYDEGGVQYTAPVNSDRPTLSANLMLIFNTPLGKSQSRFSVNSFTRVGVSSSLSYTGEIKGTSLEEMIDHWIKGRTTSLNVNENLTFTYRDDQLEIRLGGMMGFQNAWYEIKSQQKTATWSNNVNGEINWTAPWGMEFKTDCRYNFYFGYDDGFGRNNVIWNAELSQTFLQKRLTLRFKVYDILNQSSSQRHTNTDNYVQDVISNTLGRYVMLSLTFRFGTYNNQGPMGGRGGHGPGGMGGGRGPMGPPPGGMRR